MPSASYQGVQVDSVQGAPVHSLAGEGEQRHAIGVGPHTVQLAAVSGGTLLLRQVVGPCQQLIAPAHAGRARAVDLSAGHRSVAELCCCPSRVRRERMRAS